MTTLHILFSPKAEGCPRLALALIDQQAEQTGNQASVAFLQSEPGDLTKEFEDRCAAVHFLGWRAKGFLTLFSRTLRLLRRERPRGIICYTLGHHIPISIAARIHRIPIVVHVGCAPPADPRDRRKLFVAMKMGAPFVNMHIACSDVVASDCRKVLQLKCVQSIPNGIDIPRFMALRRPKSAATTRESRVLGMVASLAPSKDHAILLEMMAVLKNRGSHERLVLAGTGTELERLQELAQSLDVKDRIDWLGNVKDIRSVLNQLDIFVFASPSEGLGIALVEAMAAGVPVVASDVPGCREVLDGGRWGRLVSKRDAEVWADAMTDAASIPVPPERALQRYDIRETWRAYAEALRLT